MLTKNDLKLIRLIMEEMRDDLHGEMEVLKKEFEGFNKEIQNEMNHFRTEVKNNMVTFKDEIVGEIRDVQIDSEIIRSYKDTLESHEERITKLESKPSN